MVIVCSLQDDTNLQGIFFVNSQALNFSYTLLIILLIIMWILGLKK